MRHFFKFFFAFILFFSTSAYSEISIAFIDMNKLMNESNAGKSISQQLEKKHKKNIDFFKKKEKELKSKESSIISQKNVLSKEDFQKEITALRNSVKKYNTERNEKINSLTKKRLQLMEKILKVLSPILTEYSKERNISIVMDKKYIIVGKTELNLTDEILKLLDSKIKKINVD